MRRIRLTRIPLKEGGKPLSDLEKDLEIKFPYECAESTLLGGLMKSPEMYPDCARILQSDDFQMLNHPLIWDLLTECIIEQREACPAGLFMRYGEKITTGDLTEEIPLKIFDYMQSLFNEAPITANLKYFANEVKKSSISRKMTAVGQEMATRSSMGLPVVEQLEQMANLKLFQSGELITGQDAIISASDIMEEILTHKDKIATTGFDKLDEILGGLSPGDLTIIAARPGMGKTQFMLNLLVNYSKQGKACSVISLEMTIDQIIGRIATMHSGVNFRKFTAGKCNDFEQDQFSGALHVMDPLLKRAYFSVTDFTPLALEAEIKILKAQNKVDVLFIDYLQLVTSDIKADNREREIAAISKAMKNMAKKYKIIVVCLAQLNRAVEQRVVKKPMPSDLRDSGSIEQDADQILMLYRPKYYDPSAEDTLEIAVVKNRHGSTGEAILQANMARGTFH